MEDHKELREISRIVRRELEKEKQEEVIKRQGWRGVSHGQITGLVISVMSIPMICVWLVLPFISKKN